MCGSQQFQMMKGVSESLSGRIGLITLLGFSLRKRYGLSNDTPFLPTDEYFDERKKQLVDITYEDVWKMIHRSVHRAARQPCLYGVGCRDQSADSTALAFDSCSLQHCLSAEAILKQHHQACSEDSKAVFLRYRSGRLSYTVEHTGCFEKRRYGRCFL